MFQESDQPPGAYNRGLAFLDPSSIRHSPWSRNDDWFLLGPEIELLMSSIERVGGNLQPIKVRSIASAVPSVNTGTEPDDKQFEIVFGYSRLYACQEVRKPVFAIVDNLSEMEAVRQFASEFRSHPNWRPWRLGLFLNRVIDGGLLPTIGKACDAFSLELSEALTLLDLGRLPRSVMRAYDLVNLQPSQGRKLIKAFQLDPETVSKNSIELDFGLFRTAPAVFSKLTEQRT